MRVYGAEEPEPIDDEDLDDLNLPDEIKVGNRKHRRRVGVRSSYKDKLRELQKERDRGDGT